MRVKIFDYGMNGEGVAKIDNKIVLIEGALNGEEVDITITKSYANYSIAKLDKIILPSPMRINTPCGYSDCGGCALQNMAYAEQLKFKQQLVKKTLKKVADIDADVLPTVAADKQFNYRNKASFVCDNLVGFYKKSSNSIVEIANCRLMDNNINKVLNLFNKFLKEYTPVGIKNLVVRSIDNQVLVAVVSNKIIPLAPFAELLKNAFKKVGLYLVLNTRKDKVVLTNNITHIFGIKQIETQNFNIKYSLGINSFHQTNIEIQNKLYAYVQNLIDNNAHVVNGFSGVGLLSAIIAQKARHVEGIEIEKSAHLEAEKLKIDNKIANLTNILGDFLVKFNKSSCDTLILDPAKRGCGKKIMQKVCGVKNLIYISCNPISMAKDLREIKNCYIIESIKPFDMFPNTLSVETVVKLKLKE